MDDETLVTLALDGDDDALAQLHERYVHPLFQYVYVHVRNYHDAEELIQDIFFKMARNLGKFERKSSFKTWLFTIGRNAVIDYHRKQRKHKQTMTLPAEQFESFTETGSSAEERVVQQQLYAHILDCLNKLPIDYRTVLHLRFIEGFSIADTAKVMSKTSLSVKSLQHRAKNKLMELMGNEVQRA